MVKRRVFPESNYSAIYYNGKTVRIALDHKKPILPLEYPEFYDVKITDYCEGACPWCYMDSTEKGAHAGDPVGKIERFFGDLTVNQRPFQVAIGGGEPTQHPEFVEILEAFHKLGITPNYTTNGTSMTLEVMEATKKYCGGVAVSAHPHLIERWQSAVTGLCLSNIKVNFHILISDKRSIDYFRELFDYYGKEIRHYVLLPYTPQGRAVPKPIDWDYLVEKMPEDMHQVAFGAGFHDDLKRSTFNMSLYDPESMSKFLDLGDMSVHPSSFQLETA